LMTGKLKVKCQGRQERRARPGQRGYGLLSRTLKKKTKGIKTKKGEITSDLKRAMNPRIAGGTRKKEEGRNEKKKKKILH